eukprot:CAMPEP_0184504136 /NCGR_PEP_ID=MMETSP0113_2-20130426/52301_1 /TAXON_ID=91329 /ORGANISM="Norrisiella sphaerica, Strain BC52" /LENGTH=173 /DNA_ID=CAMNT_0026893753 /DNA_START=117 /DNA_END=638 /DNA_ORIENTATION=+
MASRWNYNRNNASIMAFSTASASASSASSSNGESGEKASAVEDIKDSLGPIGERYDSSSNTMDLSDIVNEDATPEKMYVPDWVDYLPTEYVQDMLYSIHNTLDLPWVPTIALATIGVRMTMLPLVIAQARYNMRLAVMQPYLQVLRQAFRSSKEDFPKRLTLLRRNINLTFRQ